MHKLYLTEKLILKYLLYPIYIIRMLKLHKMMIQSKVPILCFYKKRMCLLLLLYNTQCEIVSMHNTDCKICILDMSGIF